MDATVRIISVIYGSSPVLVWEVIDVDGAFLQGRFKNGERMYVGVPNGFEQFYGEDECLELLAPLYGTKQAAKCYYDRMLKEMKQLGNKRSNADPCLYSKWDPREGLVLWISWVDDNVIVGTQKAVDAKKAAFAAQMECKMLGKCEEYLGCVIDVKIRSNGMKTIKFTQPVQVQSLEDEFDLNGIRTPVTPGRCGSVLSKGNPEYILPSEEQTHYRRGVGKLAHMSRWSRPESQNPVRECARMLSCPIREHVNAMKHIMKFIVSTPNVGWTLKPQQLWDGSKNFVWVIRGRSDSDYAKNKDDRKSVSGSVTYLNEAPVIIRSSTQRTVALSVTEAETKSGVVTSQDMLFTCRVIESLNMKVKLPMLLEMDNKGSVDAANSWGVGGRMRHIDVQLHFLRELKERGIIRIQHVNGDDNEADILTKNPTGPVFTKHVNKFVSD